MQIQDYLRAPDQERHVCAPHVVACHVDDDAALLQLIQNAMAPVAKGECQASTCTEDFGAPDLQLQLHGLWQLWGQPTVNHIQPTTSQFRGRMAEGAFLQSILFCTGCRFTHNLWQKWLSPVVSIHSAIVQNLDILFLITHLRDLHTI